MKYSAAIMLLVLMLTLPTSARLTFTQCLQQKAKVQLRQDKELDLLVNGREADPMSISKPIAQKPVSAKRKQPTTSSTPTASKPTQNYSTKPLAYTMRTGWRVKFFSGGSSRADKENAQAAGREFKQAFPDVSVYMHFISPHWICVAGNFVNKEDADAFVNRIKSSRLSRATGITVIKSRVKVPVE